MADKTKSQTYNFLLENKSIEDIKKQTNIEVIKKRRHSGSAFKIIEKINDNDQQLNDNLSENEKFYDAVDDLNNIFSLEISQTETEIQKKDKEIEQLKNEIELLKQTKQSNVNFDKFKYNAVTIYNEKQRKDKGIEKIHEEILPIEDKIIFITTFVHTDNSISEQIIYFTNSIENKFIVKKQTKYYKNINEYKSNIFLIDEQNQNLIKKTIKDFLKKQQDFKLKPTKKEIGIWIISWLIIPLGVVAINFIHPPLLIMSLAIAGIAIVLRGGAEVFSPKSKKVWSWISNKICKNEETKEKNKKERQSIIKNLTSDKLETILETQYDILKQELDNRKEENPDKLISNNTINHNSNSILENSTIESENNHNFDWSIKNTVNNQVSQPSTISTNTWNKVKWLLT